MLVEFRGGPLGGRAYKLDAEPPEARVLVAEPSSLAGQTPEVYRYALLSYERDLAIYGEPSRLPSQ